MSSSTIARAKVRLVTSEPFFATILLSMKLVETNVMPDGRELWMAATDGSTMWINPENVNPLPLQQVVGLLKHEVLHVVFLHPWRVGDRNHRRWNKATDDIINDIILKEGGELPEGGRIFEDISLTHTAESRYAELPDEPEGGKGGAGGDGDGDGDGDPFDGDLLPAPGNGESKAISESKAKAMIAKAAAVARAQGKLPGVIAGILGDIFDAHVPWEEVLTQFLTDTAQADYSWARPNRRFIGAGMYLPGLHSTGSMRKLGVIIDTSGSVSDDELRQFFGEVVSAVESVCPSELIVVYCDSAVSKVDRLDAPSEDDVREVAGRHGGGGTDMTIAQRWFEDEEPETAAVLVFTDGYTPFSESPIPTLWCITSDVSSPHGQTVRVVL